MLVVLFEGFDCVLMLYCANEMSLFGLNLLVISLVRFLHSYLSVFLTKWLLCLQVVVYKELQ